MGQPDHGPRGRVIVVSAPAAERSAPLVSSFGYVGVTTVDLAAWEKFGTNVLGLEIVESTPEGLRLRADERAWRVSVAPGDGSCDFIGWEVADAAALDAVIAALGGIGVETTRDSVLAKERGVAELVRAVDPAGMRVEFFYGQ